ncbi:outer membrane beta-barrel protein [Dyadobacter psychrophilus]|uniref:outer membrane beta-barrel protein n=1 Tax=Dyadobacter psychrophilus TaxID=651661 RepID=UPI001BAFA9BA|nr:outer membrane beta-barrel protein [Dyadobacter psychrophilus]
MRLFRPSILCIALLFISYFSSAQNDSVFLKNQIKPVIGKAVLNYKKQDLYLKGLEGKRSIPFAEILEIKNGNGKYYVSKVAGKGSALFVLLVKGPFSLLFNEKNKLFYIEKKDSVLVISQQHIKRALPIIFGKELLEAYYIKSNIQPQYSARYLKNLTLYANQSRGADSETFEESLNQFKASVRIGPYIGYGYNNTAFDINAGTVKGRVAYRKTEFTSTSSIPLGLRADLDLSKRVGIEFGVYFNSTKAENIFMENTGVHVIPFPQSILIPKKYDTDLKTTAFSYQALHFDLAMNVNLNRDERSKFKPYAFAGPTVAIMLKNQIKQATGYQEDAQSEMGYFYRWTKLDSKKYLVGFNAGLGVDYALNKRITLNASAKFTGGLYPKIRNRTFLTKTQNDTSAPDTGFGVFESSFWHSYDQYLRMFSVGLSANYKL